MNKTIEYIEALKKNYKLTSDYQVSKKLGVSRERISNYRTEKSMFDDEMCIHVADLLKLDPLKVIADVHGDRAKKDTERQFWRNLAKHVPNLAAGLMAFAVIPALLTLPSAGQCILCKIGRIRRNDLPSRPGTSNPHPKRRDSTPISSGFPFPHRAMVALA